MRAGDIVGCPTTDGNWEVGILISNPKKMPLVGEIVEVLVNGEIKRLMRENLIVHSSLLDVSCKMPKR